MIRVDEIHIKDFRGVREITLKPGQKNFAICGPNGTGKSGVVDALEFALTGSISRLKGAGTGNVSVKEHGPHVNYKNNPDRAVVTLKIFIPSLKKTAVIERSIKNAKKPKITPADEDVLAVLQKVEEHPEIALSRREIIKYVISEPGQRAKDVQTLLKMEEIEKTRATLTTISNAATKAQEPAKAAKQRAETALMEVLGIGKVTQDEILRSTNTFRSVLGLPALAALEATTSLKDGLESQDAADTVKINKAAALLEIEQLQKQFDETSAEDFQSEVSKIGDAIAELADGGKLKVFKDDFYQTALELFNEEICPICDKEWEPVKFRALMQQKIEDAKRFSQQKKETEKTVEALCGKVENTLGRLREVCKIAQKLPNASSCAGMIEFGVGLTTSVAQARKLLPLEDTLSALQLIREIPAVAASEFDVIRTAVTELPEISDADRAKTVLLVADERLSVLRREMAQKRQKDDEARIAADVLGIFNQEVKECLEKIYADVQAFFIQLYTEVNEDEPSFQAELIPSDGKLGFDVDFYGKGFYPPGAYHSEGHQDGMGLCLYLALMKHLLGKNFTFAVLDDVMMSVDADHRRALSKMLKKHFPETQFILTTHDPVWLRLMKSEGLIGEKAAAQFRKWDVESGPIDWDDKDVWTEINETLGKRDVPAAAGELRRYLEFIYVERCDDLGAPVQFHADGKYVLGDLIGPAIGTMAKRLSAAKASAQSWGRAADIEKLNELGKKFQDCVQATNVEQWQVNASVHYNEWANMTPKDFKPVVEAHRALLNIMRCAVCETYYFSTPKGGQPEAMRCSCGDLNANLIEKPKDKKTA